MDSVEKLLNEAANGKITIGDYHARLRELRWQATGLPWWLRWLVEPFI